MRYIGCSNFTAGQMVEAHWTARQLNLAAFVSCQDEYSLLARGLERDLLGVMERYGLGLLPYFPLATGLLTGKYKRGAAAAGTRLAMPMFADALTETNFDNVEQLEAFASARPHAARARVLLARRAAARRERHRRRDQAGADRGQREGRGWQLTPEELAEIDKLTKA